MRRLLPLVLVVFALGTGTARAATLYAAPAGTGAVPCAEAAPCTLPIAVGAAGPGDTVVAGAGDHQLAAELTLTDAGLTLRGPGPGTRARLVVVGDHTGVRVSAANVTLRDVDISGATSGATFLLIQNGADALYERIAVRQAGQATAFIARSGVVRDSLVTSATTGAAALIAGRTRVVNATVLAPSGDARAIEIDSNYADDGDVTVVRNTIARGGSAVGGRDLSASDTEAGGPHPVTLDVASSSFSPGRVGPSTPNATITLGAGNQNRDTSPPLLDGPDQTQAANSPTEDAGAADPALGGFDLEGTPRPVGPVDIGADERAKLPAASDAFASSGRGCFSTRVSNSYDARVTPNGAETTARFEVTEGGSVRTLPAAPAPGAGIVPVAVRAAEETAALPGKVELVLTSSVGTTRTVLGLAFAGPACPAPPDPKGFPPAPDTKKPALTALRVARTVKRGKAPTATFALSEAASVRFVVERVRTGRKRGAVCSLTAKRGTRCTKYTRGASITRSFPAGAARLALPAAVKKLPRGTYRVTAIPTDGARLVGSAVRVRFAIR